MGDEGVSIRDLLHGLKADAPLPTLHEGMAHIDHAPIGEFDKRLQCNTPFRCKHGKWIDIRLRTIVSSLPAEWDLDFPLLEGDCLITKYKDELDSLCAQAKFCYGCVSWKSHHSFVSEVVPYEQCQTCRRQRRL